jgi:hypothetical protein
VSTDAALGLDCSTCGEKQVDITIRLAWAMPGGAVDVTSPLTCGWEDIATTLCLPKISAVQVRRRGGTR